MVAHVSRALFERHRLPFALHLARSLGGAEDGDAWNALLDTEGGAALAAQAVPDGEVPGLPWVSEDCKMPVAALAAQRPRVGSCLAAEAAAWQEWCDAPGVTAPPPAATAALHPAECALVAQAMRPDALVATLCSAAQSELAMGALAPAPSGFADLEGEADASVPVLLFTAPGSDPCQELQSFAKRCATAALTWALPDGGPGLCVVRCFTHLLEGYGEYLWLFMCISATRIALSATRIARTNALAGEIGQAHAQTRWQVTSGRRMQGQGRGSPDRGSHGARQPGNRAAAATEVCA